MDIILDLLIIILTIAALFLAPLVYYLVAGQFNSPTARERSEKAKLKLKRKGNK